MLIYCSENGDDLRFYPLSDAYPGRWMCYRGGLLTYKPGYFIMCGRHVIVFLCISTFILSELFTTQTSLKLKKNISALPIRWIEMQESHGELFLDESLPQGNSSKDHPLFSTISCLSTKRKQALIEEPWMKSSVSHFHLCYD